MVCEICGIEGKEICDQCKKSLVIFNRTLTGKRKEQSMKNFDELVKYVTECKKENAFWCDVAGVIIDYHLTASTGLQNRLFNAIVEYDRTHSVEENLKVTDESLEINIEYLGDMGFAEKSPTEYENIFLRYLHKVGKLFENNNIKEHKEETYEMGYDDGYESGLADSSNGVDFELCNKLESFTEYERGYHKGYAAGYEDDQENNCTDDKEKDRELAIKEIEGLFPPDAQYKNTAETARRLWEKANEGIDWRDAPDSVIFKMLQLCREEERQGSGW